MAQEPIGPAEGEALRRLIEQLEKDAQAELNDAAMWRMQVGESAQRSEAHHRTLALVYHNIVRQLKALAPLSGPVDASGEPELGLHVDMLDVDRLRLWANRLDEYGPNVTEWGSVAFVVEKLRDIAARLEQEIRDVGELRKLRAAAAVPSSPAQPMNRDDPETRVLQAVLDAIKGTLDPHTQIADHPNVKFAQMQRLNLVMEIERLKALSPVASESGATEMTTQDYLTLDRIEQTLTTVDQITVDDGRWMLALILRLAALPPSSPVADSPTWQPIETAPKDGTNVLVGSVHRTPKLAIDVARWREEFNEWYTNDLRPFPAATHWMPLPSAPSPSAGAAKESDTTGDHR